MIVAHFSDSPSLDDLQKMLAKVLGGNTPEGLVILGCVENPLDETAADGFFRGLPVPVAGGLFPALLFDGAVRHTGWIVYGVYDSVAVTVVENISQDYEVQKVLFSAETSLIIVDGHARRVSTFLKRMYSASELTTRFFGGGAGSLASSDRRCVITSKGLLRDAAVVMETTCRSGIGVGHGWRPASSILRANATDGNMILQLDYKPAFEVYAELVAREFNGTLDAGNLIATGSMFPLGIRRIGGSLIVRDPIAVSDEGGLICVGEVDTDCFIYLLTSDMNTLLNASLEATRQAEVDLSSPADHKIVFDCISRYLLMKNEFSREIALLRDGDTPVSGVLSIGEVASSSDGFLEFYNKTTAVAAFPGD